MARLGSLLLFLFMITACSGTNQDYRKPIVYPGEPYASGSPSAYGRSAPYSVDQYEASHYQADPANLARDTSDCEKRAASYLGTTKDQFPARDIVVSGATGAALGAATGALAGVIMKEQVGRATGAGAAIGGLLGGARGALRREENPKEDTYYRYVEECLRERGHRVIGWEDSGQ
jgi:hypothetical protein